MPHFGGNHIAKRCGERPELLLDPGALPDPFGFGVSDAGVLVDLAEEVLAIDELERASPQVLEVETASCELLGLPVGHPSDEILVGVVTRIGEAFAQSAAGARTRHDELHLGEVEDGAVVEVGDELVGEEGTDAPVTEEQPERLGHRCRCR